jgi:hypothetical protein
MFGVLFGVKFGIYGLFANRGIPHDSSDEFWEINNLIDVDGHSRSFFYSAELKAVNWEHFVDEEVIYYTRDPDTKELTEEYLDFSFPYLEGLSEEKVKLFVENELIEHNGRIFQLHPVSREKILQNHGCWRDLLSKVKDLGEKHGDMNVRVVVVFGN